MWAVKKVWISSGKISAVQSLFAPSGSKFYHWPGFLMCVKHSSEHNIPKNILGMLVQILSYSHILVVVLGLRDRHSWFCLLCPKRHITNERHYLHQHHEDLLPQLLVRCTLWLRNKSQRQNPIAHIWSCWKVKTQFLGEHQLTHCPCLNDWQGYSNDIPCIQNDCSVLCSNNNCILPAPLLIHSSKWQLWAVKVELEISCRFRWNNDLFCFITSLLTLSENSHSYSWPSFLALRCLVQARRYAQGLLLCKQKQGLTSSAISQGPCNINFWYSKTAEIILTVTYSVRNTSWHLLFLSVTSDLAMKIMAAWCSCCPRVSDAVRNTDLRKKPLVWVAGNVQINP